MSEGATAQKKDSGLELREIELPSGKRLGFQLAGMVEARALLSAFSQAMESPVISSADEFSINFVKNMICRLTDSSRVWGTLEPCLRRCTYEGERIIWPDTFEALEPRSDYIDCCAVVLRENLLPFWRPLISQYMSTFHRILELRGLSALMREKAERDKGAAEQSSMNSSAKSGEGSDATVSGTPLN